MSDDSDPLTLTLNDETNDLSDDQDAPLEDTPITPVQLISLHSSTSDIALKERKTTIGRDKRKCSEGAVLDAGTISGVHCIISSRSMTEAGASIWIRDVSSNGVWVNKEKIPKDEPVKITNGDTITFYMGTSKKNTNEVAYMLRDRRNTKRTNDELNASSSVEESGTGSKKRKLDESTTDDSEKPKKDIERLKEDAEMSKEEGSAFEKEFECGICHDIMYKALALQPCLHSFCKECCKAWFQNSSECPSCRQQVDITKRDFRLNNLITLFLKSRPQLKREDVEEDGAESDTSNVIRRTRNRNRNRDDQDDDEDDEGDDDDDDDSDSDGGRDIYAGPIPPGFNALPPNCPCCDPNNNIGYVCPIAVRLGPLPPQATLADYFNRRQIQPGHDQCHHCKKHIPVIPPATQDSVAKLFQCNMCHIRSCGCRTQSVDDRISRQSPISGFLNRFEDRVISDYLAAEQLTSQSVWQEIKDGLDDGSFNYVRPSYDFPRIRNTPIRIRYHMKVNRRHFVGILYDCILFEYGSQVSVDKSHTLSLDDLADTFAFVAAFYKHNRSLMDIPCDQFITRNQLHTVAGLVDYIENMDRGVFEIFPCSVELREEAPSFPSSSSRQNRRRQGRMTLGHGDSKSKSNHNQFRQDVRGWTMDLYGHRGHDFHTDTDTDLDDEYSIIIPGLSKTDIQTFLWEYAYVSEDYQDDIATLIRYLRKDEWMMNGSKGSIMTFDWDLEGVQKFSKEYNQNKIRKVELREQEEAKKTQEVAQKQQEEWTRQQELIREREIMQRMKITDEFIWKMHKTMVISSSESVQIDNLIKNLEMEISEYFDFCFVALAAVGSFACGLYTHSSDLDLTLTGNTKNITTVELVNALHHFNYQNVSIAESNTEHAVSSVSRSTRMSIVTFIDPKTGTTCHLTLDEPLLIYRSKLIRTYALIEPRFGPVMIALKHLTAQRRLISSSEHGDKYSFMPLGSYALALMLTTFLQTENPPLLPKLQQNSLPEDRVMKEAFVNGIDCSFDRDWEHHQGFGVKNTKSAAELLVDFCRFFGYVFDYESKEVNARTGAFRWRPDVSKAPTNISTTSVAPDTARVPSPSPTVSLSPTVDSTLQSKVNSPVVFQVIDPFLIDFNVTNVCRGDLVRIVKSCFQEAYEALVEGDMNLVLSNS
ncbi:hypothetical protein BGX26_008302 [Mortierella sp. AD094]|nr:hypothetical protein BGX26_008302 [Mortierella sp. AD094]